tara:strand:- start:112 stop:504 length:393 start_codon:yes stop_codon:yes gene_type:complete
MRKQYHFRPSPEGLRAWDVDRLVALSSQFEVRKVPLTSICELDEPYWYGIDGDGPTCRSIAEHARLIAETDLKYPIILSQDGGVMDGMHRVCKAWLAGDETILAVQFEVDPEPDYIGVEPQALPYEDEIS